MNLVSLHAVLLLAGKDCQLRPSRKMLMHRLTRQVCTALRESAVVVPANSLSLWTKHSSSPSTTASK